MNKEPLAIPYRHGILHGWEMAYDNNLVAAKSWAALLAIREWAMRSERGERDRPEPEPTFQDLLSQIQANEDVKKKIAAWKPRSLTVGEDVPPCRDPSDYQGGSPERALVEFLYLWSVRNYRIHDPSSPGCTTSTGEVSPAQVREVYHDMELASFRIQAIRDEAPSRTEIDVHLNLKEPNAPQHQTFRLAYSHPEKTVVRGDPEGQWGIVNWRF